MELPYHQLIGYSKKSQSSVTLAQIAAVPAAQLSVPALETIYVQKAPTAAKAHGLNTDDANAALTQLEYERVAAPAQAMPTTVAQPQHVNPVSIMTGSMSSPSRACQLDLNGCRFARFLCTFADPSSTTNDFVSTCSVVPSRSE